MNPTDIKTILARHYDYAPHGEGQFFHGDWFTPKHKDSLDGLLEELMAPLQEAEVKIAQMEEQSEESAIRVENLEKEIESLNEKIEAAKESLA